MGRVMERGLTEAGKTMGTLFSGGEGVGTGAKAAGYRHLWGIEYKPEIAAVAEANGFRSIIADVRDVDPTTLVPPYLLHLSPPCLDASGANGQRIESQLTKELGHVSARYIQVLQPHVVTLENVWYYRHYEAFDAIVDTLFSLGYMVHWQHLNAADYGVPQTRKRLILRAVQGELLPQLPEPEPWVGWYEAIEDLIPTLPESQLAPWQVERLPEDLTETCTASMDRAPLRATLIGSQYAQPASVEDRTVQVRNQDEPSFTITASYKGDKRALLCNRHVVTLTPRALARLQSFPDCYELPESKTLACRVIGNAVPPRMYRKLVEPFI
jgi:DNA (cytosine-5)-methyltransferase 1